MNLKKDAENEEMEPLRFHLSQNYPNPFNEKTTIKYCLAYKTRVKITVYNSEGKIIKEIVDEIKEAGTYEVEFKLSDCQSQLVSENYLYRMEAGDYSNSKQMKLGN